MTFKQFSELHKSLGDDDAPGTSKYYYDENVASCLDKVVSDEDAIKNETMPDTVLKMLSGYNKSNDPYFTSLQKSQ